MAEASEKKESTGGHTTPPRSEKKCGEKGCKRPYRAKGYCNVHYRLWRHGELKKARYKICSKEACRKPAGKGGLCEEHFKAGRSEAAPAAAAG